MLPEPSRRFTVNLRNEFILNLEQAMKFHQFPILAFSAVALLVLSACGNNDAAKTVVPGNEAVAAKVNGVAIGESSLRLLAKERGENPDNASVRKSIIDQLAVQIIASEEALAKGLEKTVETSARLELNRRSLLATAFAQDYLKNHPVSEDVLKAEYDKIKARPLGSENKVRHIMLATEAEANEVIAKLKKNPKLFGALAREKSKDTASSESGGDLGWSQPPTQNPEFDVAVANLTKGQFTEKPVKTYFGWHVVWLEDKRTKPPLAWEQIKPALQHQAEQEILLKIMDEMKAKSKIDITQMPVPAEKK